MENNNIDEKPMTIKDIREVLIPAMAGVFATKKDLEQFATKKDLLEFATKKDIESLKIEMREKFDTLMNGNDQVIKDLEILMTEKTMGYHQKQKERKLWQIMIQAMQEKNIFSGEQMKQINELEIF